MHVIQIELVIGISETVYGPEGYFNSCGLRTQSFRPRRPRLSGLVSVYTYWKIDGGRLCLFQFSRTMN